MMVISAVWLAAFLWTASAPTPQDRAGNPRQGGADQVRAGTLLFQARCAECHGADAKGVVGPDLTVLWTSAAGPASPVGVSDDRVFRAIRAGVPGSVMPPSTAPDDELWAIVAYLRSLGTTTVGSVTGNTDHGQELFWSTCGSCHRVNGRGGQLGPDLSRIADRQSRDALTRAIRDASASIAAGYQAVTLVTTDGTRIRGVGKGEDAFSIQIMNTRERLQGYLKASLREVVHDQRSLMPDFGPDRLNDRDLEDLVGFLGTLRAAPARR